MYCHVEVTEKSDREIYLSIARYSNELTDTIGFSKYDDIKKMLNISYQGKVPSKAAVTES